MKYIYKNCKLYQDDKEVVRPEKYTDEWIKYMKLCIHEEAKDE